MLNIATCPICGRPVDVATAINTGLRVRGTRPAYFHADCVGANKPRIATNNAVRGAAMAHGHEYKFRWNAVRESDNETLAAELLSNGWKAVTGGAYESPKMRNLKAHKKLRTAFESANVEKVRVSVTVYSSLNGYDTAFLESIGAFDGLHGVDVKLDESGAVTFKIRTRSYENIQNCYRFAQAVIKSVETKIEKYGYGYKSACAVIEWISRRASEYGY